MKNKIFIEGKGWEEEVYSGMGRQVVTSVTPTAYLVDCTLNKGLRWGNQSLHDSSD